MDKNELTHTANRLVADGKGILAADESFGTIEKRLNSIGVKSTAETRRSYRQMLFDTPGIEEFLSGVILFDETIRQTDPDGRPLREMLSDRGILVGIKVDRGKYEMPNFPGETITEGLDGLRERFTEYFDLGARFAKWRSVISIGPASPSHACIQSNADGLAQYAALAQEAGLTPILEPEVLMDGDHGIDQCAEATQDTLQAVFDHVMEHRVMLEGLVVKPNMVLPGRDSEEEVSPHEVAARTVATLKRAVPAAVPGVAFLSGGQDAALATERLNAMNKLEGLPWRLTFSFSRAIQGPVMSAWKGDDANTEEARKVFLHRLKLNSAASRGQYYPEMDKLAA